MGRRDPLGWDDPLRHLVRQVETFPAPVIAMVEGGVWGGACEVVLACDMIIAAPNAQSARCALPPMAHRGGCSTPPTACSAIPASAGQQRWSTPCAEP
jgi:enoyl-CoA hydratase/carnithine racemase